MKFDQFQEGVLDRYKKMIPTVCTSSCPCQDFVIKDGSFYKVIEVKHDLVDSSNIVGGNQLIQLDERMLLTVVRV